MDPVALRRLLKRYRRGDVSLEEVLRKLKALPFCDLGFARVDTHRSLRSGFPEVVYGPGKTLAHLKTIVRTILAHHGNVLVTRLPAETANALRREFPSLLYFPAARLLTAKRPDVSRKKRFAAVVCAGTGDIPVAEEASLVCEVIGTRVERVYDVGVAGLHRLLDRVELLQAAVCLVVIAGMEGALASVVGGLVNRPVIAVPTSVGYGAHLGGIAPLLTMLNSCAPNVAVVNIDNGFGAGYLAALMARSGGGS